MLSSLIIAALVFVYALYFLTGSMGRVWNYAAIDTTTGEVSYDYINGANFMKSSQSFVSTLVVLAIILIVLAAVMYLMGCNTRRNYYITNYIAIGLFVVFEVAVLIYLIVGISTNMNLFLNDIAWETGTNNGYNVADMVDAQNPVKKEYLNFILGYLLCFVVLADAVLLSLTTLWKVKLMKGEKELLAASAQEQNETVSEEAQA